MNLIPTTVCIAFLNRRFKHLRSSRKWCAFLAAICLFVSVRPALAITINLNYVFGDINPLSDPNGNNMMAIMQAAANRWADIIEDDYTMTLNVSYVTSPCGISGALGCADLITPNAAGNRTQLGTVTFGSFVGWYFDPTPNNDTEFNMAQTSYFDLDSAPATQMAGFSGSNIENQLEIGFQGRGNGTDPNLANTETDMLSVAFHEIGHHLGVNGQLQAAINEQNPDNDYDLPSTLLGGHTMAVNSVNAAGRHFVNPTPLMGPALAPDARELPTAADVLAMAAVSGWTQIDMPRKEFLTGTSWNTAANWIGNRLPDAHDDVFVRHGGAASSNTPVAMANLTIGRSSQLTVSSTASASEVYVGRSDIGTLDIGTLTVAAGGDLVTTNGFIGFSGGSTGTATVFHDGSTWTNNGDLIVGYRNGGLNILDIHGGGAVSSNRGFIGDFSGSRGRVLVDGAASIVGSGATWNSGSELRVGNFGEGTLVVAAGGDVSNSVGYIATFANSTGLATIQDNGSTWNMTAELRVGNVGTGALNVVNGADVSNTVGYVGNFSGSTGTATVTGAGSTWTNSSDLIVGFQSSAANTLNVQNGGVVNSVRGFVGDDVAGVGTVNVTGVGSRWNGGSEVRIGNFGRGTLNLQDGEQFMVDGYVGYQPGSVGHVNVVGAGSEWNASLRIFVGFSGTGEVRVLNGGAVYTNHGRIGFNPGSNGRVYIDGAGSQWNSAGSINVGGSGTGLLSVSNGGTVIAAGGVTINPGSELLGNGTVTGYVFNAGDVRPGTEVPGSLGISGEYNQHTTGKLYIEIDAANSYDSLSVTGNITLDGMLNVSIDDFPQTYVPAIGDSFDILNWTGTLSGAFDLPLVLPNLPDSRMWNTSQLYTSGVISVVSSSGVPGDYNGDGVVGPEDHDMWKVDFGMVVAPGTGADGNGNGIVDAADYTKWRDRLGFGGGSAATLPLNGPVPEPTSLLLAAMGLLGLICHWSRRSYRVVTRLDRCVE